MGRHLARPGAVRRREMDGLHDARGAGRQQHWLPAGGRRRLLVDRLQRRPHARATQGLERLRRRPHQLHPRAGLWKSGRLADRRMHRRFAAGGLPRARRPALVPDHQGSRLRQSHPAAPQHQSAAGGHRGRARGRRAPEQQHLARPVAAGGDRSRRQGRSGHYLHQPEPRRARQRPLPLPVNRARIGLDRPALERSHRPLQQAAAPPLPIPGGGLQRRRRLERQARHARRSKSCRPSGGRGGLSA